jgi:hypothetical protein
VNAEEAFGAGQVGRQVADRDRGGVGADDRLWACGRLDVAQHLALDLRLLEDGFLDEVRIGDRIGQAVGCAQVGPDQLGRPGVEEPLRLEVLGFGIESIEVATSEGGVGVGDDHVETGHGKDLRDAAAHVARANDGDALDLTRHAGHDLPWLQAGFRSGSMRYGIAEVRDLKHMTRAAGGYAILAGLGMPTKGST